jgi:hypothetical protein
MPKADAGHFDFLIRTNLIGLYVINKWAIFSNPLVVKDGVPQGRVFGPALLNLYVNDLLRCITFSEISMFIICNIIHGTIILMSLLYGVKFGTTVI